MLSILGWLLFIAFFLFLGFVICRAFVRISISTTQAIIAMITDRCTEMQKIDLWIVFGSLFILITLKWIV